MTQKRSGIASIQKADVKVSTRRCYSSYEELHDENPELEEDDVYSSEVVLALEDLLNYNIEVGKCEYKIGFERLKGEEGFQDNCAYMLNISHKRAGKTLWIFCGLDGTPIENEGYLIMLAYYERNISDRPVWEREFVCDDESLAEYIDKILEYRNIDGHYVNCPEDEEQELFVNFLESAIHKTMTRNIVTIKNN